MKSQTLIELLNLSTNLYMISKDEKRMEHISEMAKKGKEAISGLIEECSDEKEKELLHLIALKAAQAKEELDQKIEKLVTKMYEKLNIAHTDQVKGLEREIASLKARLVLVEQGFSDLKASRT